MEENEKEERIGRNKTLHTGFIKGIECVTECNMASTGNESRKWEEELY